MKTIFEAAREGKAECKAERKAKKPEIDQTYLGYFGEGRGRVHATAIVIHHTCTASAEATRRELKKAGYSTHFEVEKDGHIYQYMPLHRSAAHCGSPNCHCIGIDATHAKDAPWPAAQVDAVRDLVAWLCEELSIERKVHKDLRGIYPHRALGCTECPQDFPLDSLV